MTLVRTLATIRHHAMELSEYGFTVPLDHDAPAGETLTIFARAVKHSEKASETKPWLIFLQGGPGSSGRGRSRMTAGSSGRSTTTTCSSSTRAATEGAA